MLTGYQCEVIAYYVEGEGPECVDCATENGAQLSDAMIRYSVDEYQSESQYGDSLYEQDPENHVEDCECVWALMCAGCDSVELAEGYTDTACEEKQEDRL